MRRYQPSIISKVINLRRSGKTYSEINGLLGLTISKSTLSGWCRNVSLPGLYIKRVSEINRKNLNKARQLAVEANRYKRIKFMEKINIDNRKTARVILNKSAGKVALAMLCLGEASKYKTKHKSFSLGSSDYRIITLFLSLLKRYYQLDINKVRCTVQCRADQDIKSLEEYWKKVTNVPSSLFYPTRIDPRTVGKKTKNMDYKGVLVVDYYDRQVQLKLESLAEIVYNLLKNSGPVA